MAHFRLFGFEVRTGDFGNARLAGDSLHHADAGAFELANFFGVVGEKANLGCAELLQDFGGKIVVAGVRGKT